jgi:hypothetical protein
MARRRYTNRRRRQTSGILPLVGLLVYGTARWFAHQRSAKSTTPASTAGDEKAAPVPNQHTWQPVYIGKQLAGYADENGVIVWGKSKPENV